MAKRVVAGDGAGTWRCLQQAIDEANELIALAPEGQVNLLKEHRDFVAQRLAEMACYMV
jgi:hypothetical protein